MNCFFFDHVHGIVEDPTKPLPKILNFYTVRGLGLNFETEQVMNEILASMESHWHWNIKVQHVIHGSILLTHLESDLVQNTTSDH